MRGFDSGAECGAYERGFFFFLVSSRGDDWSCDRTKFCRRCGNEVGGHLEKKGPVAKGAIDSDRRRTLRACQSHFPMALVFLALTGRFRASQEDFSGAWQGDDQTGPLSVPVLGCLRRGGGGYLDSAEGFGAGKNKGGLCWEVKHGRARWRSVGEGGCMSLLRYVDGDSPIPATFVWSAGETTGFGGEASATWRFTIDVVDGGLAQCV